MQVRVLPRLPLKKVKDMNKEMISDQIIQEICEVGLKAYLCGGAIRDHFLDVDPQDYDIVTEATPEDLKKIFSKRKIKTGIGTNFLVTIVDGIDVATYRSDKNIKSGRNNCITTACKTLEEDLSRRDFTCNALALCPYTGEIVDPFNGLKDLEKKVIRFVGNPDQRIYEDYLRMIRAARFTCLIEGRLDKEAFDAISKNKELINKISKERIRIEILKTMKYRKPSIFFNILHQTGILNLILPELSTMHGASGGIYHAETLYEHAMITGDSLSPKDPILRLVGYLHDIGKPTAWIFNNEQAFIDHENIGANMIEEIFEKYKFTTKETQRAKGLVRFHMRSINENTKEKGIRRLLNKLSEYDTSWKDWLQLKIADKNANLANENFSKESIKDLSLKIHKAIKNIGKPNFKVIDLDINGHDIMEEFNLSPGPKIGIILNNLFNLTIDNPSINNKSTLLKIIKENNLWDL